MSARLFRQWPLPARLSPWRWHCLGIAILLLELAFLAWVLMRQPSPIPPPPALPPPPESSAAIPAASVAAAPTPPPVRPLPRRRPATPPRFLPTWPGRAAPAMPTLAPTAAAAPMPTLPIRPTLTAAPAVAQTPAAETPAATPPLPPTPAASPTPGPIPPATLTPPPAATPPPPLTPTPIPQLTADIALRPDSDLVAVGRQFRLRILVQAGESNPVDAVQVYLVFDPARFAALALTAGPALEIPLQSDRDNALGRLDYAAGTLGAAVIAPFTLATVTFRALAPTGPPGTYIAFAALQAPRRTKAVAGGANITGNLTSAYMLVE